MPTSAERPLVVLVTGVPGSGKTSLGTELAQALRVPFLARDDVRGGLFLAAGAWSDRPRRVPPGDEAVETFLRIVEAMAGLGVSCVVEYVVRSSRPEDLERLTAAADCVVLVTWCADPEERRAARSPGDRLLHRPAVLEALGFDSIEDHELDAAERMRRVEADMRTDFDLPTLLVCTADAYEPGIGHIIDFVTSGTSPLG